MTDPYKVLGLMPDATDEEIKKTYRELAKKYHPDSYNGNPLSDLAAEKMKEINEAYDMIVQQRKNGSEFSKTYGGTYNRVRDLIQNGRFSEAEILLQRNPERDTNAEWNFLYGVICRHKGWLFDARQCFENACRIDPSNQEYRMALSYMDQSTEGVNRRQTGHTSGCSGCDICMGLMCLDCLCGFCR